MVMALAERSFDPNPVEHSPGGTRRALYCVGFRLRAPVWRHSS